MRIAFSTLGCPDFDWVDIYTMAKDLQFDGIEVRGIGRNIHAVTAAPFTPRRINQTDPEAERSATYHSLLLLQHGAERRGDREAAILEITEYIELAHELGTPYIRVLADRDAAPEGEVDDDKIAEALLQLADFAKGKNVTLLVETNGVYGDTARLRRLLDKVNRPEIAALWDIHHPYRYFGEDAKTTVKNLGAYIRHVHAKDSVVENGRIVYKMMGEGDLPVYDMLDALTAIDFDGFVSLEWVKRWMPDLTDAGIVFPHFAHFMQTYAAQCLQTDNRGTGKYLWPKEHLIDLTFPEVLDRVVKEFPDQYAFRYTTCDYTRTYAQFRDDVDQFARALIAMGVKKGDHVAIWATNIPQWFITFWASARNRRGAGDGQHRL